MDSHNDHQARAATLMAQCMVAFFHDTAAVSEETKRFMEAGGPHAIKRALMLAGGIDAVVNAEPDSHIVAIALLICLGHALRNVPSTAPQHLVLCAAASTLSYFQSDAGLETFFQAVRFADASVARARQMLAQAEPAGLA